MELSYWKSYHQIPLKKWNKKLSNMSIINNVDGENCYLCMRLNRNNNITGNIIKQ